MTNDEGHKESLWKRKSAKIAGVIVFVATIIGVTPIVSSYYKSFRTKDVSGQWKITCHIKSSSYKAYIGKSSGFKIYFTQEENKVTGKGEMWWIDDKEIPYSQHVLITMEGKVNGEQIVLSYTQNGAKRTTVGEINLQANSEGILEGTFSGTAADAKGIAIAERIE